jgi:CRP-like cAMP-binding protein
MGDEASLIAAHLEAVDLPAGVVLERSGRQPRHAHFFERGLACVVVDRRGANPACVAMLGRELISGLPALLGATTSPHDVVMIVGGASRRISISALVCAMEQSPTLRGIVLAASSRLMLQLMDAVAVNARQSLDCKLARWLVMAHDRLDGNTIPVTHETLSAMIGVRRASISIATQRLKRAGAIAGAHRHIEILDRAGLAERCKESRRGSNAEGAPRDVREGTSFSQRIAEP